MPLPVDCEEETMKEIILDVQGSAPREISRGILERVLGYSDYRARDDMTVLVANDSRKVKDIRKCRKRHLIK